MHKIFAPLSRAAAPIADGVLRRALLQIGVQEHQAALAGVPINYYLRPAAYASERGRWQRALATAKHTMLRQRADQRPTPIVLVHGLGDNALTWALVIELLAPGREVYAIDLPGYGLSGLAPSHPCASLSEMCDVLAAFLRDVVGRPALVAGNSMGGWLAVRLAQVAPALLREITLINPGGAYLAGQPSWEPFRSAVAVPDLRTTRQVIRQVLGFVPATLLYFAQHSIQDRFQRRVVRAFVEQASEGDFLTAEELRALRTPASQIWGLDDGFLPAGSREFFTSNLNLSSQLLIAHCGHLPQREHPLQVARFLDARASLLDRA
jgi:pimeloyl-ACP methyl ester carboxylesterase